MKFFHNNKNITIKISITMKYKNKYTNNQNDDKIYLSNTNCFKISNYKKT